MFRGLALAIAHLKVGFKTRKLSVGIYPNRFVYVVLDKLRDQGLILGYGAYKLKGRLLKKKVIPNLVNKDGRMVLDVTSTQPNNIDKVTIVRRRQYLISVFFKYNLSYESVLQDITLISTSGHRVYFKYAQIYKAHVKGDVYLVSTSGHGLLYSFEIVLWGLNIGGEMVLKLVY